VLTKFADRFIDSIEFLAALFVGVVAVDVFMSILLRYFFGVSIPDSYDFGRLLLGVLIFWGIGATSYRGTHITVDLLYANVGPRWQRAIDDLKREGLIRAIGISVNRWEATNVMRALETGLIDSVQVVYNIFDQAPEDELFPYCQSHDIAVIARVPFDEGSLTGTLTRESRWPEGDWRNIYFNKDHLAATLTRVDRLAPLVPEGMDLPELALRFILEHPAVSTTIPGMRRPRNVEKNLAASDGEPLPPRLHDALKGHRWNRVPNATP